MSLIDETKRGNVGQVIALLSSGRADPNMGDTKGNTALHHAVDKGAPVLAMPVICSPN